MRVTFFFAIGLLSISSAFSADIRQFDLKTTERLGNELWRRHLQKESPDKTNPRGRAKATAIAALKGHLYSSSYTYEVIDDPAGSGFLVYALAGSNNRSEMIIGGHFRVSVSANGSTAKRIDDLSKGIIRQPFGSGDRQLVATGTAQAVDSNIPVETFIYTSNLYHIPIGVGTRDGAIWMVENGRIQKTNERAR